MSTTEDSSADARSESDEAAASADIKDLRERVRDITLQALTRQRLDQESIRHVLETVTGGLKDGFTRGFKGSEEELEPRYKEAIAGVDEALKKTVQAARLATEEALGEVREFVDEDLKKSLQSISSLEQDLLESLKKTGAEGSTLIKSVIGRVTDHMKTSGTAVGHETKEAISQIQDLLARVGKQGIANASDSGRKLSDQIAQVASGILSGMADAINPQKKG